MPTSTQGQKKTKEDNRWLSYEKTGVLIWKLAFFDDPSCFFLTPLSLRDTSPNNQGRLKRRQSVDGFLYVRSRNSASLPLKQEEGDRLRWWGFKMLNNFWFFIFAKSLMTSDLTTQHNRKWSNKNEKIKHDYIPAFNNDFSHFMCAECWW